MRHNLLDGKAKSRSNLLRVSFLALTLWFALGLRLIYVRQVSPFLDEYISMLAAQSIIEQGAPILPSGLFYGPKALLHSYISALALGMFGPSEFAARFPSVIAGVITVCYVYLTGRNWFSPMIGLLAAMALAWLPSAIEWGGRARMYSLLQLLSLVGAYLFIRGYLQGNNRQARVVGILIMLLAIFAHTLALIVLGGVVIGILISRSISPPLSRPPLSLSLWEILAGIILIITIVVLDPMGGPWGAQVRLSSVAQGALDIRHIQERILYLLAFAHQFVTWPLWPLTIFYTIGFITLSLRLLRKSPIPGDSVALSLYILVLCAWLATSILSGLHDDRYLFVIIPFYLLLVFREFYLLTEVVLASLKLPFLRSNAFGMLAIPSILTIALFAPSTIRLVNEDIYGFAPAFLYVRDHWRSGDVVATCSPAPSQLILGHTNYYVIQQGAEVLNGVDVWTGAPLIDTREEFAAILGKNTRVWFVIEKLCWERHFDTDFHEAIEEKMKIAFDWKGMLVFVSNPD
jgi:4-amino-4-deoxy-L-arabinose transferase-like glycosyltransferase